MTAQPPLESPLAPIPNKRYFTIGEVGGLCDVKSHVLRYWEQEFTQLKPTKRRGNRRYYQRHDIELIRLIRTLLYDQGFTIAGARQQLVQAQKTSKEDAPVAVVAPREPVLDWSSETKEVRTSSERVEPLLRMPPQDIAAAHRTEPMIEAGLAAKTLQIEPASAHRLAVDASPDAPRPLTFPPNASPLSQVRHALVQILNDLDAAL